MGPFLTCTIIFSKIFARDYKLFFTITPSGGGGVENIFQDIKIFSGLKKRVKKIFRTNISLF